MNHYTYDPDAQFWHRPGFSGIDYCDGREIEQRIFDIISETSDQSVLSDELRRQITDWPTEYHLSSLRHCLLRPLGIQSGDRVLELGCGCGAITRYLGETGAEVVSVEGSVQRARIAAQRCRDLDNVRVVLDNLVSFDTEQHFDWVLLIGVLEYAPLFSESVTGNPVQKYLQSASLFLSESGKLVVAIENQLGLKYFNGCGEDHVSRPFFGIHDLYNEKTPVTFGKEELQLVLQKSGLHSLDFYYPWPDYKLPSVVLHSSAFTQSGINIRDMLLRCTSRDYTGSTLRVFSEQFVIPVLERNSLLEDLSNSFLVIAEKDVQERNANMNEFAWIYSCSSRQKNLGVETIFLRHDDHAVSVEKRRLDRNAPEPVILTGECTVVHHCGTGNFFQGDLLVWDIIRKRADGVSSRELAEAFFPWFDEVLKLASVIDGESKNLLENHNLSGKYIDATPFNYIRTDQGGYELFDTEWEVSGNIPLGWVLYRSVVWGVFGSVPDNRQYGLKSVYNIIKNICAARSLEMANSDMICWQDMELLFQSVVSSQPPGGIPQFLSSESGDCFPYVDKQQQRIDLLEGHLGSMQRELHSLYLSSSWRYSKILRIAGNYKQKVMSLFRNIGAAGNPVHALSKVKGILKQDGWKGIQLRIAYALHGSSKRSRVSVNGSGEDFVEANDYPEWIRRYDTMTSETERVIRTRIDSFARKPLLSIVMPVFDPPVELLEVAIESVLKQFYPHWELCIADDASTNRKVHQLLETYQKEDKRIKVVFRKQNGHISRASNSALELAEGEFIALMDHDDLLSPHALFMVADIVNRFPDVQLAYSDEDKIDTQGERHSPLFKSDWNPDLFLSYNCFSHLGVYKASLIREVGGFRPGFEGAQDYDLALRCTEHVRLDQIVHIPHVLYHWRALAGSTALATDEKPYAMVAGERAINEYLQRSDKKAVCKLQKYSYRVRYSVPSPHPLVSLIIPLVDEGKHIKACVSSILAKTTYDHYEILIIDSSSHDRNTVDYLQALKDDQRIRIIQMDSPENNDAHLYNTGVQQARGDIVGFLHDDIKVISNDWLLELVSHACRKGIGAVGARLWFPDNTLAHGGFILGISGTVGCAHRRTVKGMPGYKGRAEVLQSLSAVSGACLFVEKSLFKYVGWFDEGELGVYLYDVDLCLKLCEQGYFNMWTPYAELFHLETGPLNNEDKTVSRAKIIRAQLEFVDRWRQIIAHDPVYNQNLTLCREDFSLAWPPGETVKQFCEK